MISALNVGKEQEEKAEPRTRRVSGFSLCECYEIDTHLDTSAKVNKKLSPERDLRPDSVWRRWRDLNSRAGERPTSAFRVRTLQPLGYISKHQIRYCYLRFTLFSNVENSDEIT